MRARIRHFKKFVAEFLCAALITCSMPGPAFAAERDDTDTGSVMSDYNVKDPVRLTASLSKTDGGSGSSKSGKRSNSTGSGIIWTKATIVPTKGTWTIDEYGHWRFTDNNRKRYVNEWGYIYYPYSETTEGLPTGNWYHFGNDGIMDTGWYSGRDRKVYYLDPDPGSMQGAMMTGWVWIDGNWYYFDSNGELLRDTQTPDGYIVNGFGARV